MGDQSTIPVAFIGEFLRQKRNTGQYENIDPETIAVKFVMGNDLTEEEARFHTDLLKSWQQKRKERAH